MYPYSYVIHSPPASFAPPSQIHNNVMFDFIKYADNVACNMYVSVAACRLVHVRATRYIYNISGWNLYSLPRSHSRVDPRPFSWCQCGRSVGVGDPIPLQTFDNNTRIPRCTVQIWRTCIATDSACREQTFLKSTHTNASYLNGNRGIIKVLWTINFVLILWI